MRRCGLTLFGAGALLLLAGLLLSFLAGATTMPSYLADWLFWSSLPLGALFVVMVLDLVGPGGGFGLEPALRGLLAALPLAALLVVPILLRPGALFSEAAGHGFDTPFAHGWMTHDGWLTRSVAYFVVWVGLAVLFMRPPSPLAIGRRRALAAAGLLAYALTTTLAAADWAMAVEPGWYSPEYGLLIMAAQSTVAVCCALLLAGRSWRDAWPETAAAFLIIPVAAWIFLQFIQFLVIWSADRQSDIAWYLHRTSPGSRIAIWVTFCLLAAAILALLSPSLRRRPALLPATAVLVLCLQALGMLWMITPSLRHNFTVNGMDLLELFGLGGVTLGACLWFLPAQQQALRHG